MPKSKPQSPHQIATQRVEQMTQWALDNESLDSNENTIKRAISEWGIERRQAERLMSRVSGQFSPITGGRPQTHARPVFDMREPVFVLMLNGTHKTCERGQVIAADKTSITVQIGTMTIKIGTTTEPIAQPVDWFNESL